MDPYEYKSEYFTVEFSKTDELDAHLNRMGRSGWRLKSSEEHLNLRPNNCSTVYLLIFERPAPKPYGWED